MIHHGVYGLSLNHLSALQILDSSIAVREIRCLFYSFHIVHKPVTRSLLQPVSPVK
jgi:hypothetical protein